ncbi:unnamed protein product [Paramecium sonneborni]|nr:unnamed protein product [Paramecium sonneborni]
MKRDFNKNKFNLSTKLKTHSDCDFKFQTPEKLLLIKYSENFKTTQNYQLVQTLYKTHNFEYSSLNYQIKSKKLQFEKIKQQFPKFTISQNNKTGHKLQRNSCPRLSTSLEFQVQTQKNYNKYLIQPQMIEQNKNNQTKLNPILSNEVFFEKQTESYFQYPLHPLPKTTQSYQKQYSAFIKNKGPKIGDVTQMKNWRQSVLKKINQCKSQLQN